MSYRNLARVEDADYRQQGVFAELSFEAAPGRVIESGLRVDRWPVADQRSTVRQGMASVANATAGAVDRESLTSGFIRYEHGLWSVPARTSSCSPASATRSEPRITGSASATTNKAWAHGRGPRSVAAHQRSGPHSVVEIRREPLVACRARRRLGRNARGSCFPVRVAPSSSDCTACLSSCPAPSRSNSVKARAFGRTYSSPMIGKWRMRTRVWTAADAASRTPFVSGRAA
jgi:hypothetical protein